MPRAFKQVDVFTNLAYRGNPLAVVLDAVGLTPAEMQSFTDWTNLSEATFLLPPEDPSADYKVRIFCPGRELPFAGHPTLGSCHAWLESGGKPKREFIVQECGVGLVKIRRDGDRLAFAAPPLKKTGPLPEAEVELIARGLGIQRNEIIHHSWCDNGPNWRGVMLATAEQVLSLKPDAQILAGLDVGVVGPRGKVGVVGAHADGEAQFELRAFFPVKSGMAEDPVTGSLNAGVAQWLIGAGLAPKQYIASQGTVLGRAGRVYVQQDGDTIWIGGSSVTCIEGSVKL
ncbi:MAG: PhzF family phenazine biosynthesis protein [Spirochaetes bacterium]|nr:PhzF family phenazine biosynthesis protein [Spirochaetota bacterium]